MPPRKSKTPEQLHEEELDKMTCPPISYLINVEKKDDKGNRIEMSSWRYVDLANALNACTKLFALLSEELMLTKNGEASSGVIEMSLCDRDKKPVKFLLIASIKDPKRMTASAGWAGEGIRYR